MLAKRFMLKIEDGWLKNSEKSRIVPKKNPRGDPLLVFPQPLRALKIGLVRDSNPDTPAAQAQSPGLEVCVNQTNDKIFVLDCKNHQIIRSYILLL